MRGAARGVTPGGRGATGGPTSGGVGAARGNFGATRAVATTSGGGSTTSGSAGVVRASVVGAATSGSAGVARGGMTHSSGSAGGVRASVVGAATSGSAGVARGGTIHSSGSAGAVRASVVGATTTSGFARASVAGATTTTSGSAGAVRSSVVGTTAVSSSNVTNVRGGTGGAAGGVTTVRGGPVSVVSHNSTAVAVKGGSPSSSNGGGIPSGGSSGQLVLSGGLASDVSAFLSAPPVKAKLPTSVAASSSDSDKLVALLRVSGLDSNMKAQILSFLLFAVVDQANKANAHKVPGLLSELSNLLTLEGASDQTRVRDATQAFLILSATDEPTREAIRSVGGIEKMGKLLARGGSGPDVASIKENSLKALLQLVQLSSNASTYNHLFPALISVLKDKASPDSMKRHSLQLLHLILQQPIPPAFTQAGGVDALIESLSSSSLNDLAIVLLAKMTSSPELRKIISEKGASAIISNLGIPSSSSPQSVTAFRNALVTLSNLCVDEANSDRIAQLGGQKIMELLKRCAGSPKGSAEGDAVNLILQLLINISTTPKSVDSIVANDGLSVVISLARDPVKSPTSPLADETIKSLLVSLLSGLLTNDEVHDKFIKESGVKFLVTMLTTQSSKTIKKEAAKGIANISQFYEEIREDVGKEKGVFDELVKMIATTSNLEEDIDSKRQSLRALTNLSLSYNNVNEMLKCNIVTVIKRLLDLATSNTKPNRDLTFFTSKLLVNLTAHDKARPIVSKEIGVDVALNMLKDDEDSFQLQSLKLLTNLSIQGSNRKKLHEKAIVEKVKNAKLRSGEVKQQTDVALANLSFPYEDKYDENGVAVATSPSSEGIVLPPLAAPFLLPHELLDDDDDDDIIEKMNASISTPLYKPETTSAPPSLHSPSKTASIVKASPNDAPSASPSKAKPQISSVQSKSMYISPKAAPTATVASQPPSSPSKSQPPPPTSKISHTVSFTTPSTKVATPPPTPSKPLPPSPKQDVQPATTRPPATSTARPSSVMGLTDEQRAMHNHRTNIAKEILSTEMSYVAGLKQLIWKFFKPLSNSATTRKPMINQTELKTIFSNIEVIYNYNSVLLEGLENRLKNWSSSQRIGDIFIRMTDYLRCYVEYVNNYQHSLDMLNKIRKERPTFHNFLRKQETSKECRSLPLDGFLITPVQRVPRYELLLRDLLKFTWTSHVDYQELTSALLKMKETNVFINEKKRESEGLEKLFAIDNKMVGNKNGSLFEASRRWIKDGPVMRVKKGAKLKPGWMHLFNDVIILSAPKGRKKDKKFHWRSQAAIESLLMEKVAPSGKVINGLRFLDKNAKEMEFIVVLNTEEEQMGWHRSVQDLQKILHQRRISFRTPSIAHLKQ